MNTSLVDQAADETERLNALESYGVLDTAPEQAFDDLAELAALICGTPVSLVSLVSSDRQFFKARHGFPLSETPRSMSFCAHTLQDGQSLQVEDATKDSRFVLNPLVTGDPNIRFYAGAPIVNADGLVMGTVCVIDRQPRQLSKEQSDALQALARQATTLLEQRRLIESQAQSATVRAVDEAKLLLAAKAGELGIFTWYPETNVVLWENDRMYEIFGRSKALGPYSSEEFLSNIVHPDWRTSIAHEIASIRKDGDRFHWLGKVSHPSGSLRWVEFHGLAEMKEDDELYLIGTLRDVTELKANEEALSVEKLRLNAALSVIQATTFDWEVETDRIDWAGVDPFGRSATELQTASAVWDLVHPDDAPGLQRALEDSLATDADLLCDYRAFWPDGSIRWIRCGAKVITEGDSEARRLRGVNLEVTDRKLAEVALLRHEKLAAVGRLASTMAHEINNPLEAVTNLLYIARNSPSVSSEDKELLDTADQELARVTHTVAQTLRFNRSLASVSQLRISGAIDEILTLYKSRLDASKVDIRLDLKEATAVQMGEGDFRQILDSLVNNSFDAMRTGGKLHIRVQHSTDWPTGRKGVAIVVSDTGPGIPANIRARIFEAFFSTKGIHGAGLGLWACKRIAGEHEGRISFRSRTGDVHGTVFRVWLPN